LLGAGTIGAVASAVSVTFVIAVLSAMGLAGALVSAALPET